MLQFNLLLVLIISLFGSYLADSVQENPLESAGLESTLFAGANEVEKSKLNAEETQNLLAKVRKFYPNGPERYQGERGALIESLFMVSEVDELKCEEGGYFRHLRELMDENAGATLNLIPYLEHYKAKQLEICRKRFANTLRLIVAQFSDEQKEKVANLLDLISGEVARQHDKGDIGMELDQISASKYTAALLAFVEANSGTTTIPSDHDYEVMLAERRQLPGERAFTNSFVRTIDSLCIPIRWTLDPWLRKLDYLFADSEKYEQFALSSSQLDSFSRNWIQRALVCRNVSDNITSLASECYKALSSELYPNLYGRFMSEPTWIR